MNKYLITGAAGFIGSHVSERLLKRGDTVVGIDNLNNYYDVRNKEQNLEILRSHRNFSFIKGDIVDIDTVEKTFSCGDITHVGHLAARAGVRPSIEDPFIYGQANFTGTLNLLEVCRKFGICNFVLTSSSSVYGNSKKVPFREDDMATDKPISPYAATKKSTEVLGYTYHHLYGLNVNVVRPFTVYGPRGRPDMAPWLFVEAAILGKKIKKFGDGSTRRDYTFIDDFTSGFINALDRPLGYEIFNLGNSDTVSLNDALRIVSEVTGKDLNIEAHPMQPGDVEITNADVSKVRRLLDYKPNTSFREGMGCFADWFISRRSS